MCRCRVGRSVAYRLLGRNEQALTEAELALQVDGDNPHGEDGLGRNEQALTEAQMVLQVDGDKPHGQGGIPENRYLETEI